MLSAHFCHPPVRVSGFFLSPASHPRPQEQQLDSAKERDCQKMRKAVTRAFRRGQEQDIQKSRKLAQSMKIDIPLAHDREVPALLDTGSEVDLISMQLVQT